MFFDKGLELLNLVHGGNLQQVKGLAELFFLLVRHRLELLEKVTYNAFLAQILDTERLDTGGTVLNVFNLCGLNVFYVGLNSVG